VVVLVGLLLDFFSSVFFVSFDLLAVLVFELVVAVELEVDFGALFVALVVLVVLVGVFVFCVNFCVGLFVFVGAGLAGCVFAGGALVVVAVG